VDDVEQYSELSRSRLASAAEALIEAIRSYTAGAVGMRGGSSEHAALFERTDALVAAVGEFNERSQDHSGFWPLPIDELDDDDEGDEDDGGFGEEMEIAGEVRVLSRWDLAVVDAEEFLAAGRAAHRRTQPSESEEDARVAIASFGAALYALTHERSAPWFDIPGVEILGGAQVYLMPDEPFAGLPDEDMVDYVTEPPRGTVTYTESWV
jgi:hypothetical protein